jgi:hypothetical protein
MSTRLLRRGAKVKREGKWLTVASIPLPHRPGCYLWRDGCVYTIPELVEHFGHVEPVLPPPPETYTIVPPGSFATGPAWEPPSRQPPPEPTLAERDAELVRLARLWGKR